MKYRMIAAMLAATGLMLPLKAQADNSGETQSAKTDSATSATAVNTLRSDKTAATPAAAGAALSPTKTDAFVPIEWITIPGGKFMMGSNDGGVCYRGSCPSQPVHEVTIKTFQMAKTLVTVEQYAQCVRAKKCTEPIIKGQTDDDDGERLATYCNWGETGRERHPVNCVDWNQANQYIKFVNESQHIHARLPSEAEWEYAARSGGEDQTYPWGNEEPNCDRAVMYDEKKGAGCGANGTMPVCSKPAGNTKQGLCDMAGNIYEWMQDIWHGSYAGAPTDGSAWEEAGSVGPIRVFRGGASGDVAEGLRSAYRSDREPGGGIVGIGFRAVRSSP